MKSWIAVLVLLAGCEQDGTSSSGPIALVVSNAPDPFSIASGGASHTGVFTYAWPCGDDQARISLAEGIASGTVWAPPSPTSRPRAPRDRGSRGSISRTPPAAEPS